jgi:HD superfamily phosphodiesterase
MPGQYRRHALTVYRRVSEQGCEDPAVLQAALLHDAGKHDPTSGRHVTLGHRVAIVLLKSVRPGRLILSRLAEHDDPEGLGGYLLYPFHLSKHHAERAARLAAQLGAQPEVVSLIVNHHSRSHADPALTALQAADEAS